MSDFEPKVRSVFFFPNRLLYNQLMFTDMILPGWWCTHQLRQCFCWGGNLHSNVMAHVWKSLLYKCIQHVQLASVALLSVPSGGLSWFLHPTPPTISACVCLPYMEWLQLRGAWLAIGQIVLPVGLFSVHSWFPFFRAPYPSLLAFSSCSLPRGHTTHTQNKDVCSYISPQLLLWSFYGLIVGPPFLSLPAYNWRVLYKSTCSQLKYQHCLFMGW